MNLVDAGKFYLRTRMDTNPLGEALHPEYAWPWTGYTAKRDEMPLAGYATLLAAFGGTFVPLYRKLLSSSEATRPDVADVVMFGVATHKIGRIITKDWVTSPLRAPFVEYIESSGGGEVKERSRGAGLRRAA